MGPLAGTAANVTALSYNGILDMGLFIDPVAIEDPADYRTCVEEAFEEILALAPDASKAAKSSEKAKASKSKSKAKSKSSKSKAKSSKASGKKKSKKPGKKAASSTSAS